MKRRVKYRWLSPDGYIHLGMSDGRIVAEHRHVWECAYGAIPDGHQIHHRDGNRANNRLENLVPLLPGHHKREHVQHWTGPGGEWWKRCTKCGRAAPEDDFPTKRYVDGVRKTRGNCHECERARLRAKKGLPAEGNSHRNFGRFIGPRDSVSGA
ncbi:HNH endonuclease [Rhodovulum sp. 12E13]|uniref:HNH endonuclease signature motif containing protein n=1 Tax=Rhodovulum sp. 12E13 TaxID=2203891 RepID=UPI000E14A53D|nr:HNH endonuclease signature motif containing protein [Rhodovulum sp. 12E13]RDC67728.1 HNH endonuclease [Rhodovulum sp. 12E13]